MEPHPQNYALIRIIFMLSTCRAPRIIKTKEASKFFLNEESFNGFYLDFQCTSRNANIFLFKGL